MNKIFLVARREFRHIASMRSFWVSMLILPAALALAPLFQKFLTDDDPNRIALVDRDASNAGEAIAQRIEGENALDELVALSRYVRRYELEAADPGAPWAVHDRALTPADVAAYRAAGGLDPALEKIDAIRSDDVRDFEAPSADYELVEVPGTIADLDAAAIEEQRDTLFEGEGDKALDELILIETSPEGMPLVQVFSKDRPRSALLNIIREESARAMRTAALEARGVAPADSAAIEGLVPPIMISTPAPGGGARESHVIRSILPLALAYMLLMSLLLSGNWAVQGAVEERGSKLVESVIACVRPRDLMLGKLLGTAAIGLSMILVWVLCAVAAALFTKGVVSEFLRPALDSISSPGIIIAIIYFFVMGYIMLATIFLAIGVLSDNMNEAQGFIMPIMMIILLPVMYLLQAIVQDAVGVALQVMTWFPPITPFAVLARLGAGIETWELIGTAILLAAFTWLLLWLNGRLFQASLLKSGQKSGLAQLVDRFRVARD
ncbi:ABC transporter permease [Sphingomicrobium arenosum]|uniref:ABC transporter permease n=1 Tax=Sphingomicrobium arenosum TaxID=2233861 RepID=UPI00223F5AAC|nr:ABC transporter permease [Sphingomicrobium arenosum]